jgi:hypothetical protein
MNCRDVVEILSLHGSRGVDEDTTAAKHCKRCSKCARQLSAERELDKLLQVEFTGLASSKSAMSQIMAAIGCDVTDSIVLSFLDDSLPEGTERELYEQHRSSCAQCQSREASHNEVWAALKHGFPAPLEFNPAAVDKCQDRVFGSRRRPNRRSSSIQPKNDYLFYAKIAAAVLVTFGLSGLFLNKPKTNEVAKNTPTVKDKIKVKDKAPELIDLTPKDKPIKKPENTAIKNDSKPVKQNTEKAPEIKPEVIKKPRPEPRTTDPALAKKTPNREIPVKTEQKLSEEQIALASLSKEDRQLIKNLEVLESMEEAANADLALDSDLLSILTLEDFE